MSKPQFKITNVDLFALINALFFLWMCFATYFDRFIHYRGREYIWEFFVYAVLILAVILAAWKIIRHFPIPSWLLFSIQIGILMHFAGGLAVLHESRLYDKIILGIRYDKYVHAVNACLGGLLFYKLYFEKLDLKGWIRDLQLLVMILGLGTVIEIIEYLVTLTVTTNGVGNYDNNMQDLISNFTGVVISISVIRIITDRKKKPANDSR